MAVSAHFSTKEAAVLSGLSEKAIRHEMAREIARPERTRVGKATRRLMDDRDIYYLKLVCALPVVLKPEDRKDLYILIRRGLPKRGRWVATKSKLRLDGDVKVEIGSRKILLDVKRLVGTFWRGRERVSTNPNVVSGEPVFAQTRIPIRHIGRLARRGIPADEILEDYPGLNANDVEFARMFVALRPDPGRPRKAVAFRRAS